MATDLIDEWEVEHDSGAMGFRLLREEDGMIFLDTRDQDDNGAWNEWEVEQLDGPGADILDRLPHLLKLERDGERAACAELARAAGCRCHQLGAGLPQELGAVFDYRYSNGPDGEDKYRPDGSRILPTVLRHHPGCPVSILAGIEARGRGEQ